MYRLNKLLKERYGAGNCAGQGEAYAGYTDSII